MVRLKAYDIAYQLLGHNPRKTGKGFLISCPCRDHPDQKPSCTIWDTEKGYIGIKCWSRCGSEAPRQALMDMGFIKQPAKTKNKIDKDTCERKQVAEYVYVKPDGTVHQRNIRMEYFKDGVRVAKDIFQKRADGKTSLGKNWVPFMYNLPAVMKAASAERVILGVEGEKCADKLTELQRDLAVTTNSGGSKNFKGWLASEPWKYAAGCQYWAQLEDNDEGGVEFAVFVAYHLNKRGIPVKRIALPGLGPVKADNGLDVYDWLGGHSLDDLFALVDSVDLWTPGKESRQDLLKTITERDSGANVVDIKPLSLILALTEKANAEFFKQQYGQDVIHVPEMPENERWHVWDGMRYETDKRRQVRLLVEKSNESLEGHLKQLKLDPQALERHLQKSNNRSGLMNTLFLAESRCSRSIVELNTDIYQFNVRNGTVDMRTGVIKPHTRADLNTKLVNVEWNPKAKCPKFKEFLNRVFEGNKEIIAFDQRYTGYSLTGDVSEQILVIGHGPRGANGKSTLSNIKLYCAGDYGRTIPAAMFLLKKQAGDIHSESLDRVVGYRLINVLEIPAGAKLNDQIIKDLTGGEELEARPFGAKPYKFMPECHLLFRSNYKPSAATDPAFWRRIVYVPYLHYFDPKNKIKYFDRKLWEEEKEGILNWYIEGAITAYDGGLTFDECQDLKEYTSSIMYEADYTKQFVDDCLYVLKDPAEYKKHSLLLSECHRYFEAYRNQEGFDFTPTPTTTKRDLERLGFEVTQEKKKGKFYVRGVRVRESAPQPKGSK